MDLPGSEHLKRIPSKQEMRAIVTKAVAGKERTIKNLQQEQLYAGKRSDGSEIRPGYRPSTIKRKKAKGQPTDRVTLKDKGKFYKSQKLKLGRYNFTVESTDPKSKYLEGRYTNKLLGLTDQSVEKLNEKLKPEIRKGVRQFIQGQ